MPNRLAEHRGHDAFRSSFHELEGKRATDAIAHEAELIDPEVVHQPQLVVGEGPPRVINRNRSARLAAIGVALVHRNAAEIVLEFLHGVEDLVRPIADERIQPATRGDQEGKTRADLFVTDADVALFIKRHGSVSLQVGERRFISESMSQRQHIIDPTQWPGSRSA